MSGECMFVSSVNGKESSKAGQRDWEDDQEYWEKRNEDNAYARETAERWAKITTGLMESKALGALIEHIELTRSQERNHFLFGPLGHRTKEGPDTYASLRYLPPNNTTTSSLGFGVLEFLERDCLASADGIGDGYLTVSELKRTVETYMATKHEDKAHASKQMLQSLQNEGCDAINYLPEPLQDLDRNHRRWVVLMLLLAYQDINNPDWGDITEAIVDALRQECRMSLTTQEEIESTRKEIDVIAKRLGFH